MKINRLMQVVFLSSSVCVAAPAFASVLSTGQNPIPSCGDEKDEDKDEEDKDGETRLCGDDTADDDDDKKDDKDGETRLCGDDAEEDDGDDGEGDDTETLRL